MTERDYAENAENCTCVACFQASACFPTDEGPPMTERDEPYTPSLDRVRKRYWLATVGQQGADLAAGRDQSFAEFDRWLAAHDEAVRQEERERCARIAETVTVGGSYIAARIREQGKEQDR